MSYKLSVDNRLGKGISVFVDDIRIDFRKKTCRTECTPAAGTHIVYGRIVGRISEILRVESGDRYRGMPYPSGRKRNSGRSPLIRRRSAGNQRR